jgi:hypothetical protein
MDEKQLPEAGDHQKPPRRKGQWAPGQSGNPLGLAVVRLRHEQRLAELFDALVADFPSPSQAEAAMLQQAARLLLRSERASIRVRYRDGDVAVRAAGAAKRILTSLHYRRRETAPPSPRPWSPFKERGLYASEKEATE